jgi:hypothetical protein
LTETPFPHGEEAVGVPVMLGSVEVPQFTFAVTGKEVNVGLWLT